MRQSATPRSCQREPRSCDISAAARVRDHGRDRFENRAAPRAEIGAASGRIDAGVARVPIDGAEARSQ
jgi:hypothetical protein